MTACAKNLLRHLAMSILVSSAIMAHADSVIVVSVGGKHFTAKIENSETGRTLWRSSRRGLTAQPKGRQNDRR